MPSSAIEETLQGAGAAPAPPKAPRPWTIFRSGPFRNLWVATLLSLFGDFFSYIAMAWLVLQLTGSSFALGAVLMVGALPRGILMLVGGAFADRWSPRTTMLGSMVLRAVLVAPLAVIVLTGHAMMWELYAISFVFGVVDAFFIPARSSYLPRIVADHELEPGNAVLNVSGMGAVIVGPALGGLVVAALGSGWAFAADAACFAVGVLFVLWLPSAQKAADEAAKQGGGLTSQIVAGFRYAWADVGIRATLIIIAVLDFVAGGALNVGLPVLAHDRYGIGANGLGIMLGAWGAGATIGAASAGFIPAPKRFGIMILAVAVWIGIGIAAVGVLPSIIPAAIVMALSGVSTGALNTYGISWLQRRTDPAMQGRVMSLVMTASLGLAPVSYALSGGVAELNPTILFVGSGLLIVVAALAGAFSRTVRSI